MSNVLKLNAAVTIALADADFMGDTKKVNKAIEALRPKDDVTRVFKMLQGNALKDYLVDKDNGKVDGSDEARTGAIKSYVFDKFKKHMTDPKTSEKATKMYNDAYPPEIAEPLVEEAA